MKKLFMTVFLAAVCFCADAQEVFKQIYDSSNQTLMNPKEDVEVRKIALFKVDVLTYLNTKTLEQLSDTTREVSDEEMMHYIVQRDSQAYFMYDYVNLFMTQYSRAEKKADKERVVKLFRDVSINTPLYNDANRQFVLAYFNREDFLTQFSLDTDWVKACSEVRKRMRQ